MNSHFPNIGRIVQLQMILPDSTLNTLLPRWEERPLARESPENHNRLIGSAGFPDVPGTMVVL